MIKPTSFINVCLKALLIIGLGSCTSTATLEKIPEPGPDRPAPLEPVTQAPLPPGVFAIYEIITDPPGIGVFRETGNMVGITPVTMTLNWDYAFRVTFMKKGYKLKGQFIKPTPGRHRLEVKMEKEEVQDD